MNRRALNAMVHIAKKDLALDDGAYRAVLEHVTGGRASSAADLTDEELGQVLDRFRLSGWTPKKKGRPVNLRSDKPHVRKVWAMWGQMHREGIAKGERRAGLRAFVQRMTGVTDPEWLEPKQANVIIEALKQWHARAAKETRRG